MAAEPLVLVSFHTFKFSYHNLRPHPLVSVFYFQVPSATTRLSSHESPGSRQWPVSQIPF